MDITNFDNFRAGSHFPGCLDIQKLGNHEEMGVSAIAYCYPNSNGSFVQFRRHNRDYLVALFAFKWEVELTEYWQDSTVIWDSRSHC